jgi:hypothetical protein
MEHPSVPGTSNLAIEPKRRAWHSSHFDKINLTDSNDGVLETDHVITIWFGYKIGDLNLLSRIGWLPSLKESEVADALSPRAPRCLSRRGNRSLLFRHCIVNPPNTHLQRTNSPFRFVDSQLE